MGTIKTTTDVSLLLCSARGPTLRDNRHVAGGPSVTEPGFCGPVPGCPGGSSEEAPRVDGELGETCLTCLDEVL